MWVWGVDEAREQGYRMGYVAAAAALPSLPELYKCNLISAGVDCMVTFEYKDAS